MIFIVSATLSVRNSYVIMSRVHTMDGLMTEGARENEAECIDNKL